MQTFLPYPDFQKSAQTLDRLRLGKQRVEAMQILQTLAYGSGWKNHPAVLMWKGHEHYLITYGKTICDEWISRGYADTCKNKILSFSEVFDGCGEMWWLGDERFHSSHRAALLAKNFTYYSQFGWNEIPKLDYFWPTKERS